MTTEVEYHSNFKNFFYELCAVEYIYEDEQCVAFDVKKNFEAPVHFLVVPKKVITRLTQASLEDKILLGHLLTVGKKIAMEKGLPQTGYHVVVDECHRTMRFKAIHIFGRSLLHMVWPVGPGSRL